MNIRRSNYHSPQQAGQELLIFCERARKELYSRLTKPPISDEEAFENYILEKVKIRNMNHYELRTALYCKD